MDSFEKPCILSCCNNVFCFKCLILSLEKKNNCPLCRKIVNKKDINIIDKNYENQNNNEKQKNLRIN